jgi:[acyl-carrier-protein] S-malonyltransferase
MEPAEPAFREAIAAAAFVDPSIPVYSNVTMQPSTDAATARDVLVRQLTAPVRWVGLVQNLAAAYPDAVYVELGPGNVLSGLVSRIVPNARTMSCGVPQDVDKVVQHVTECSHV